ncbi:MAG TPA: DUF559 domain-containing protein, partial [Solirubrobacterales bacterium]|nr:DUF559 domain-containing protein [Solirubrobacterales bacterium]
HQALPPDEITTRFRIPVTTVARALLDTAAAEGRSAMERALRQAQFRRLADPVGLPRLIERYPRHRGTAVARAVLAEGAYAKRTRSGAEDDYLDFARERRLPLPETNAIVEVEGRRFEVDGLHRAQKVIIELDGWGAHGTRERREEDLERDGILQANGYSTHRITPRRIRRDGDALERQLRLALNLLRAA